MKVSIRGQVKLAGAKRTDGGTSLILASCNAAYEHGPARDSTRQEAEIKFELCERGWSEWSLCRVGGLWQIRTWYRSAVKRTVHRVILVLVDVDASAISLHPAVVNEQVAQVSLALFRCLRDYLLHERTVKTDTVDRHTIDSVLRFDRNRLSRVAESAWEYRCFGRSIEWHCLLVSLFREQSAPLSQGTVSRPRSKVEADGLL